MVRKLAPACALCAVMSMMTACGAADTPTVPSSTVVTPPAPLTGVVQGAVRLEAYSGLAFSPEAPLSGAEVLVSEGAGAGQSVTTGANGAYRLELPQGQADEGRSASLRLVSAVRDSESDTRFVRLRVPVR